jgi:V/A-type H+-transporting ATPase subunit I
VRHARWLLRSLPLVEGGENFFRVTGWTDDAARLAAALDASGARALAHFPRQPPELEAPLVLRNPWWARPFEIFVRAFGMPERHAADPSALLAVIVPLLFGYMFGDVGQGAVLVVAGLLLRRRVPALGMLVAGGVSAVIFGLLFGSVFGLHGIVPALWTEPLANPLLVLAMPLAAGAALLLLGLGIGALEAYWRGTFRHWLAADAGVLVVYAGILCAVADDAGYWIAALGAGLTLCGHFALARRLRPALAALAKLVENTLQLVVNTISFVRVGAFALAHAGLSSATVALADATDGAVAQAAVLVLGNAATIVVEAMVVGVQTTRLVLFEFFTRFFAGKGREFHPLPPPAFIPGGFP